MTAAQLDEAIAHQYDNGRYTPLGADGGVLKYISVMIDGREYWADITLDHDIAQIRRIWSLSERNPLTHEVIHKLYDLTAKYYEIRS